MGENKEMPLGRREIWSRKGRKNEEERSAEEGRYDINTHQKIGKGKGKSKYIVLGLCFVLFFAAFTGIVSAAEHHVYNGDSVQDVINNAAPGDTIYVHNYSGTYAPFDVNKQLYVIGVDMPTVDGGSTGPGTGTSPITISADDCTVKGFRVIRGCPDLWECGGIKVTSSNNRIEELSLIHI